MNVAGYPEKNFRKKLEFDSVLRKELEICKPQKLRRENSAACQRGNSVNVRPYTEAK